MVKKVFYRKEGRKYIPISEYDDDLHGAVGYGDWLLSVYHNGSTRRLINPDFAPMIAAGRYCRDSIAGKLREAAAIRPTKEPITPAQLKAWEALNKSFGEDATLTWPAAQDAVDAAVDAMRQEADKLLTVPAVQKAYDQFMLVCELTKDRND